MRGSWIGWVALVAALGCSEGELSVVGRPTERDAERPAPLEESTRQVVPGPWLPDEYQRNNGPSNNNVDTVRHEGRVFLAIRNGRNHYASEDSRLYVFSSKDEQTWSFERVYDLRTDLREPRLLSYKGRLFLYFAKLGTNRYNFEPRGMFVSEYLGPRRWTDPAPFHRPHESFIPWRVKELNGRAYMTAYEHGEREYDFSGEPLNLHFLTSDDGLSWRGVDPERPVVLQGGGSEADFAFDDRGDLYAVVRNESGDTTGWGSKICHAPRQALARWTCRHDPKKYDSPYVFAHDGGVFLIGRRNVTEDGKFEIYSTGDGTWNAGYAVKNLAEYSNRPKRTAFWQVDRSSLEVRWMADLPGKGDTCFPALLRDPGEPRRLIVYNYSSPLEAPDVPWNVGQEGETRIYRTSLLLR
jgi:hypothetical protein